MALSGSFGNTFATGYRLQCDWSGTQSISNNTTTITMNLYLVSLGSSYTISSSATKSGSQTCDGTSNSFTTAGASLSGNQKKLLNTFQHTVTHNADGTKSITMSDSYSIDVTLGSTYYGTVTCSSGTVTLDTIPRKSTLTSSPSWTAPNNLAITINRADSSFTHKVTVWVQNADNSWNTIHTVSGVGTSTTITFTTAENTSIFTSLAQANSRQSSVRVETFDGSTSLGYNDYYGTCTNANASTTTCPNFNIGDSPTVTINRSNSAFTHSIYFSWYDYNSPTKTGQTTSCVLDNLDAQTMYSKIPNSNSSWGTVYCTTYYNGVQVKPATASAHVTVSVTNSNPTFPAGSISYADVDSTMTALTGDNTKIVQNKSSLTAYVNTSATAINGATFSKYIVTINGQQGEIDTATGNVNIGAITAGVDQTLSVKAYDSRGNFTELTMNVSVVPYADPKVTITLSRANKFDNNTTLQVSGSFSVMSVGGANKNTIKTITYHYRESGTSTWGSDTSMSFTTSGGTFTATNVVINLDNTKAWDFEVTVNDNVEAVTDPASVGAGQPIFFIDSVKKSIGVNKFPSGNGSFEVSGTMDVTGAVTFESTLDVTGAGTVHGLFTASTGSALNGVTTMTAGGETLQLKAGASQDQVYMAFYADSQAQTTRSAWIGFGNVGSTTLSITNQMTNGDLDIGANGTGVINLNNNVVSTGTLTADGFRLTSKYNSSAFGGWNVVGMVDNGSHGAIINNTGGAGIGLHSNKSVYLGQWSDQYYMFEASPTVCRVICPPSFNSGNPNGYFQIQTSSGAKSGVWWDNGTKAGWSYYGNAWLYYDYTNGRYVMGDYAGTAYKPVYGGAYTNASSERWKRDIKPLEKSGKDIINKAQVKTYRHIETWEDQTQKIGLIAEEAPEEILNEQKDGVDLYTMISLSWKAIQELSNEIEQLKKGGKPNGIAN